MEKKWELISVDCEDTFALIEQLMVALSKFGLHVTFDPAHEDSDMYGFFISNYEMTDEEVKEIDEDLGIA